MTNPQAKTLQIFLPTGEPRGIRIAELTTRIVQAVLIPRSELKLAKQRPELNHIALYFLFGESDDSAKPTVYIGQTEDVRKRLENHNIYKDFWRTAVLGISKTHSFTQGHIRYLEWYCIKKVQEIERYALDNDQIPGKPYVTEPMEADLLDSFETLSTLLATLGYPVFDPIVKSLATADLFYLKSKDVQATGELVEDGFVVRAGSIGRLEISPASFKDASSIRTKLLEANVIIQEDGHIRFTQDYLFNTPSGAACAVLGRASNGWIEWKDADGRTLHDIKRAIPVSE